ncbi:MAG TPA: hypothetical protein VGL99_21150 [Chloroflexota bacterium]
MNWLRWLPAAVVLLPWLLGPSGPSEAVRVRDASASASFRLLDWETVHVAERAQRLWGALVGAQAPADDNAEDAATLTTYLRARSDRSAAEEAVERLVSHAYAEQGLSSSSQPRVFPPVLVALTPPPNVLVVAPRGELRVVESLVLGTMDALEQERLEASVDSAGVISLVAPIGGLATYPSMVLEDESPERVVSAVAHEWLHQYLIFYPLGARYWEAQETREINETTAEMVGQEIGTTIAARYGLRPAAAPAADTRPQPAAFDFRAFMRATRLHTEQLLDAGQIDEAEAYMRARRDELRPRGYNIRKLNQAYFALYGSYGDGFAASPKNPIPDLLRQLRERSGELGEFIVQVRGVTSVAELRAAVAHAEQPASLHRPDQGSIS